MQVLNHILNRQKLALCLILAALPGTIQGTADYTIRVKLDTNTRILSGQETIHWTNTTEMPAEELSFHLYYNAWKDTESSFLNSNRIVRRDFTDWKEDEWAYSQVKLLLVRSKDGTLEYDITSFMEFDQPNDANTKDETVMKVPLAEPVLPGETARIELEFEARIPRTFARTGFRGDYFFVAQWFPKLGVFEGGQWSTPQFIQTEFYSDYGTYDVSMTVPTGWVLGATGTEQEIVENADGTSTHRYVQDRVHDFAWTTSPHFGVFEKTFEHQQLPDVQMRLLLMNDHAGQQDRYFAATAAGLKYYGESYGAYPYNHVTIVDPAYESSTGGMEYPTLFTGGTRWWNTPNSGSPEGVTIHEFGHQYWYGVIGNNEFEDAWMDEGFNTYSTRQTQIQEFGRNSLVRRYFDGFIPVEFDIRQAPRTASGLGGPYSELKLDRMSVPSWQQGPASRHQSPPPSRRRIYGSGAYGVNSYTKPALMLLTLERSIGEEAFNKVLSTYYERWKFKHPVPSDFFSVLNEVTGEDWSWFWDQTYNSSNTFDYAVDTVTKDDKGKRVVVRRWGEGVHPVDLRVEFESGVVFEEEWNGEDRWKRLDFVFDDQDEIVRVNVDPDRKLALDVNYTNNTWIRDAPSKQAAAKWTLKWMIWLQNVMELFTFFG